jgi:hypothetical protein
MKYHIKVDIDIFKDNFKDGEGSWVAYDTHAFHVEAEDVKDAISKMYTILGYGEPDFINMVTEGNNLSDSIQVNTEGYPLDEVEMEQWKSGEKDAFLAYLNMYVYMCEACDVEAEVSGN